MTLPVGTLFVECTNNVDIISIVDDDIHNIYKISINNEYY